MPDEGAKTDNCANNPGDSPKTGFLFAFFKGRRSNFRAGAFGGTAAVCGVLAGFIYSNHRAPPWIPVTILFFGFGGFCATAAAQVAINYGKSNRYAKNTVAVILVSIALFCGLDLGIEYWPEPPPIIPPAPPQTNSAWLPPELPTNCQTVTVFLGAEGITYSRPLAEMTGEKGKQFPIKDVPEQFTQGLDKLPNYSVRQRDMWLKMSVAKIINGKTFPYPVLPYVVSNRLYVEVEVPFLNERRKLVMSDDFDQEEPIPNNWDRNYFTTNNGAYIYEIVNESTNPVLQVVYTAPNEVHVRGIFLLDMNDILVSFGEAPQLFNFMTYFIMSSNQPLPPETSAWSGNVFHTIKHWDTNRSLGETVTNVWYSANFPGQRALFKYPSNRHPGEFADWVPIPKRPPPPRKRRFWDLFRHNPN